MSLCFFVFNYLLTLNSFYISTFNSSVVHMLTNTSPIPLLFNKKKYINGCRKGIDLEKKNIFNFL